MANTTDVVSAIRELTNTKQLDRGELLDLLKDGLHAALVKRYGPNVRAEIGIDELKGTIRIVVLRTVVETVEDPGSQVSLEEARFEDPEFQVGDVLEEEVPFEVFGRTAVQAAKQRIIRSEEHTSELQSQSNLVCRLLLEKKKMKMVPQFEKLNNAIIDTDEGCIDKTQPMSLNACSSLRSA